MPDFMMQELLAVNKAQAIRFFFSGLKDVSGPSASRDEVLYNASLLAHFAQTPCAKDGDGTSCPMTLMCVFDRHLNLSMYRDENMFEVAACQTLMMIGFFGSRMKARHNVDWYKRMCSGFFQSVSDVTVHAKRKEFFARMARRVDLWAYRQAKLERELRDAPYLLRLPSEGGMK
jgi:hypothetical protein